MTEQHSLYSILGVEPHATVDDIRRAFRRLARSAHPDVTTGSENDPAGFRKIVHAYRVLSDPSARADYDRTLRNDVSPGGRRIDVRVVPDAGDRAKAICSVCGGRRQVITESGCLNCGSTGTIVQLDLHRARRRRCEACRGEGRVREIRPCPRCGEPWASGYRSGGSQPTE